LPVLLVCLIVATMGLTAADVGQNDAGSGGDAGSTWTTALPVALPGSYQGNLTSGDAGDVYEWLTPAHVNAPYCAQAALTTGSAVDADMVAVNQAAGTDGEITARVLSGASTRIGVVSSGADGGFLNVTHDSITNGTDGYAFTLSSLNATSAVNHPPSSSANPLALPGACFSGRLASAGSDTYVLTEPYASRVTITLADTANNATAILLDSAGNVVASLVSGGLVAPKLNGGTYYLTASSPTATSYVAGLCDPQCGPPVPPCNPMCVVSLG
jgi:hypothetical protein